jgi:signal transduction histidine kinase
LNVGCSLLTKPPTTATPFPVAAIIAISVVGTLLFVGVVGGGLYYYMNRLKHKREMKALAEENEKKVRAAEHEAHLASMEQEQLRSIMGNVAHDLKTPLHSIMAEIDYLKELIERDAIEYPRESEDDSPTLTESTKDPFESLDTTCKFLIMAINRSQDYVKASSNIKLTPALDTFNVNEVLGIVHKCMVNQKCGRVIKMHSLVSFTVFVVTSFYTIDKSFFNCGCFSYLCLPRSLGLFLSCTQGEICPFLITDRHYLTENLLCLMSNASKYSDRGAQIDVRLQVSIVVGYTEDFLRLELIITSPCILYHDNMVILRSCSYLTARKRRG